MGRIWILKIRMETCEGSLMKRGCRIPAFCPVSSARRSGAPRPARLAPPEDAVMATPGRWPCRTLPMPFLTSAVDAGLPGRNSGCTILSRGLERGSAGLFTGLAQNRDSKVA